MQPLVLAFQRGNLLLRFFGGFALAVFHVHPYRGSQLLQLRCIAVTRLLQTAAFRVHFQYLRDYRTAVKTLDRKAAYHKLRVILYSL